MSARAGACALAVLLVAVGAGCSLPVRHESVRARAIGPGAGRGVDPRPHRSRRPTEPAPTPQDACRRITLLGTGTEPHPAPLGPGTLQAAELIPASQVRRLPGLGDACLSADERATAVNPQDTVPDVMTSASYTSPSSRILVVIAERTGLTHSGERLDGLFAQLVGADGWSLADAGNVSVGSMAMWVAGSDDLFFAEGAHVVDITIFHAASSAEAEHDALTLARAAVATLQRGRTSDAHE